MPTAEDRLARTAEELNRAVDGRPVPAWSPASRAVADISSSRRGRGSPPYIWLAAMVVLIAGLVALAVTVAGGDDADGPAVDPPPPGTDGAERRSIPMLDGSRLEIDLPEELAGLEPRAWTVDVLSGSVRAQLTVLPMTFDRWLSSRTTDSGDSLPPVVPGERLNGTARFYGDGGLITLVFDTGRPSGYLSQYPQGAVVVPREDLEPLARSVAVVGTVEEPGVAIDPSIVTLQLPTVWLGTSTDVELFIAGGECDPARADTAFGPSRCFPEEGLEVSLRNAPRELLDEITFAVAPPSPADGGEVGVPVPAVADWQRSRPGEATKDVAERVMAEVFGDPAITSGGVNRPGGVAVMTLETDSRTPVEVELVRDGAGLVVVRVSSPGLRRIADSTFVADVAGTLTVAGAPQPDGSGLAQEVFVEGVALTPGEPVGPFSFPESSWIEATLTTADGRILHLFEAR